MARRDLIIKLSPIGKTIYGSTKRILLLCCVFALLSARKKGKLSNIAQEINHMGPPHFLGP